MVDCAAFGDLFAQMGNCLIYFPFPCFGSYEVMAFSSLFLLAVTITVATCYKLLAGSVKFLLCI
jgi:hypothetical protein